MTNDNTRDEFTDATTSKKTPLDESVADPVAVVLLLQREAGYRQREDHHKSSPLKQAEIKERVLRRMLENSLEHTVPDKRPDLKVIK